jgi:hypothetical protein
MGPSLSFCQFSRKIALETTSVYVDGFKARLLPVFDHIEEEANAATEKAWEATMSSPVCNEDVDPSVYAEAAQEYGLEVYENLQFTRQQLLGLAAAGLYHLWERTSCDELKSSAPQPFKGYKYHIDILSQADSLELTSTDFDRYARRVTDFWTAFPENMTLIDTRIDESTAV